MPRRERERPSWSLAHWQRVQPVWLLQVWLQRVLPGPSLQVWLRAWPVLWLPLVWRRLRVWRPLWVLLAWWPLWLLQVWLPQAWLEPWRQQL